MTALCVRQLIRVAVCVIGLFGMPLAGTASAQVSVPGNYGTVQAAINAVINGSLPDGTTIDVQPGTYYEVLSVANTARSMTIRGVGGPAATVLDAGSRNAPVLHVLRATGQIVFRGLTFRNAVTTIEGGGFLIRESSPALVNCIFESNSAFRGGGGALFASNATFTQTIIRNNSASHFGGGVYLIQGSRPVFTNTDILGNTSGTGGPGVGNNGAGGGIFAHDSSPTIRGSRISGNSSKFAAGGLFLQGIFGSPFGRATLVLEDCELADNLSLQFAGEPNPAEGGGMHVEDNATAMLTRARVLRNRAGTGGGLNAYRGRYDVVDSVIDSNQSTNGFGGGIAATSNNPTPPQQSGSIVNLTTTLVRNNTAPLGGGIVVVGDNYSSLKASLSLTSSVVSGNQSQTQGGGILANRASLSANNSLIMHNSVTGGANRYGGGLLITTTSTATIATTTIAHNTAGELGGGLFINDNSTINLTSSQIYDNTAGSRGGGLFVGAAVSGTVQNNIIADNLGSVVNAQVNEDSCSSVNYPSNLITTPTFSGGCGSLASRAPGTDTATRPRFVKFLAVPSTGTVTTLAWSVARATSVTIAGIGTWNSPNNAPTGLVDVTPAGSGNYSLTATATSANGGNYAPVTAGFVVVQPPITVTRQVVGDHDGDGKTDLTVYRPSGGNWFVLQSSTGFGAGAVYTWGSPGDLCIPGDFDGDGRSDVVVYRPSSGHWFVRKSTTSYTGSNTYQWGGSGDITVPADYDGDGKTDIAVYRPSNGTWFILWSSTGFTTGPVYQWGEDGDIPVPGDYDGDAKADVVVFRPSSGHWFILRSSSNYTVPSVYQWGIPADAPVPGDYDGDGKTDIAVYRASSGTWFILLSATGFAANAAYAWGGGGDVAVPGDYDADGKTDLVVFRPSSGHWFILRSSANYGAWSVYQWGSPGDVPVLVRR